MPNRIVKESICTNEKIAQLSEFEELCFLHLIVNADDYGRLDARPAVLLGRLFPLRGQVDAARLCQALQSMAAVGLVQPYQTRSGQYLQLCGWEHHQKLRFRHGKCPAPPNTIHACDLEVVYEAQAKAQAQVEAQAKAQENTKTNTHTASASNLLLQEGINADVAAQRQPAPGTAGEKTAAASTQAVSNSTPPSGGQTAGSQAATTTTAVYGKAAPASKPFTNSHSESAAPASTQAVSNTTPPSGGQFPAEPFVPPTVQQLQAFAKKNGLQVEPQRFINFYASKGWRVGNTPMQSWQAAALNWHSNAKADEEAAARLQAAPSKGAGKPAAAKGHRAAGHTPFAANPFARTDL